jgi:hypothetical protein
MRGALRDSHHVLVDAQPAEGGVRVGDQAITTDLVAWELVLIGQHDVKARTRELLRAGAAGGPGTYDEHVTTGGRREMGHISGHSRQAPHTRGGATF